MGIRNRLKLPREHGAWGMLYVPFALGTAVGGRISSNTFLLTAFVTCLFIARESFVTWRRGSCRGSDSGNAIQLLSAYVGLAIFFGAPLILLEHLIGLLPILFLALVLLWTHTARALHLKGRTFFSEIVGVLGLTLTAPAAYYVAAGSWKFTGAWLWLLCVLYFASSVYYVKFRVITAHPGAHTIQHSVRRYCALYHCFLIGSLLILSFTGKLSLFVFIAFCPRM